MTTDQVKTPEQVPAVIPVVEQDIYLEDRFDARIAALVENLSTQEQAEARGLIRSGLNAVVLNEVDSLEPAVQDEFLQHIVSPQNASFDTSMVWLATRLGDKGSAFVTQVNFKLEQNFHDLSTILSLNDNIPVQIVDRALAADSIAIVPTESWLLLT